MALIFFPLPISDEHLPMYLLAVGVSFVGECLFKYSDEFLKLGMSEQLLFLVCFGY